MTSIPIPGRFFLVLHKGKNTRNLSARITKRKPDLDRNEVAVELSLSVPPELFERPALTAELRLPAFSGEASLDLSAAADQIRSATGLDVRIVEPEEGKGGER